MKKFIFLLLFIPLLTASNLSYSQEYLYQLTEHEEFKVSLPGDVYYAANRNKEGQLMYEELFADAEYSDFALDVSVYKGDEFDYFDDLTEFANEMAEDLEYQNSRFFAGSEISSGVNGHFLITYSKEEDCNIIFGVIQDSFARKQYEIELFCYNISSKAATSIINSIDID